jgi:cytochrome P450
MEMSKQYGNVFSIDFGSTRGVILNDYKSIREAFNNDALSGRPKLRPWNERSGGTPKGVLFTEGKVWVDQRRFILKTLRDFGFGKKSMEGMVQDEIKELAETFQRELGKPISMKNRFNGPVLNSLWHILTGERFTQDDPNFKNVVYYITEALAESKTAGVCFFFPTLSKIFPEWTGFNRAMKIFMGGYDIIKDAVTAHRNTFQEGDARDFIDVYLREILKTKDPHSSFFGEEGMTQLEFGLLDLFLAGAETTSTTLNWTFFILAQETKEQQKLFNEIQSVVGLSRLPSLQDRDSMPYTEAVIMEVLRFSSIALLGLFHTATQDVEFQGFLIPKGTMIVSNIYGALRDPKAWGDPDVFRPDRFLFPDGKLNRHQEALIPFSVGKRVCLGETLARDELFLFVTTLFQKFEVSMDPNQPVPDMNDHVPGLALSPLPHKVVITER